MPDASAARTTEARLARILRSTTDGLWEWDVAENRIWYSARFRELLGYAAADFPDEMASWYRVLHPDDAERVRRTFDAHLDSRTPFEMDVRMRTADGEWRWFRDRGRNTFDDDGRLAYVSGSIVDVTERRRQDDALRESASQFRTVLEGLHEGVALVDPDGRVQLANAAADRIFAVEPGRMRGRLVWGADYDAVWEDGTPVGLDEHPVAVALRTGVAQTHVTIGARRADGGRLWLALDVVPIDEGRGGRPAAVVCTFDDVTAERNAAAETARLAAIVESSNDAIVAMALDGTIRTWNAGAERIFGYAPRDIIGRSIDVIVPEELRDEASGALRRVALGAGTLETEAERVRRDGTRVPVAESVSVVRDARGTVIGLSSIMHDVSARRKLEAELRQAQKMEAVGRLAGGIAHDFNNLLTAILANAQFALRELDPASQAHADVDEIRRAADRAASLTRQLLAFSRKQALKPRMIDVRELVVSVGKLLQRVIGEHVALETHVGEKPACVLADPGLFEQALVNLAINARDAMPDGGTLRIRAETHPALPTRVVDRFDAPDGVVLVGVSDTGLGMDPVTVARAFEPFFTTKSEGKGTGLGLASVYGFAQQSGGTAWLESTPGVGTTVWIALAATPVRDTDVVAPGPYARAEGVSCTVLLAEDDAAVRALAERILHGDGYRVVTASNGREALARWIAHRDRPSRIEAVVTDVVMPETGGRALVRRLREERPDLPVLFMSGYVEGGLAAEDLGGRTTFIEKPFNAQTLLAALRDLLADARSG